MGEREVTPAELAEDMRALTTEIKEFRVWVDERFLNREVYDAHRQAATDREKVVDIRITAVENRQTLISRTAVTALLLPLLIPILVGAILLLLGLGR